MYSADRMVSEKSHNSLKSFEFAGDRFLVSQIFDDLNSLQVQRKYKEVARLLIELVDLLRKMTSKKEEYSDFDG